ncbi:MAG TPA: hemolysin family protein [Ignavibacteriaceae bacterium]|nr:hemolysin family protein [Ignavibacteriaceae bacterium]
MSAGLILLICLIFLSAFFSAAEMVFLRADRLKIKVNYRKNSSAAKSAEFFIANPRNLFFTTLIGNKFVNISLIVLCFVFFGSALGLSALGIFIISSVIILLTAEVLPLFFLNDSADKIIYPVSLLLKAAYFLLFPFVKAASFIYSRSVEVFSGNDQLSWLFGKKELKQLSEEIEESEENTKKENNITKRVLSLSEQRVYESMRPRTEIVGVEISQTIDYVLSVFVESRYSKLPVFEENLDNIKGIVYAHDLFKSPADLKSIIREVMFTPETKKSYDLLDDFLKKQTNIAVVIDEFGGTAGIITLEDIIEELFGEIRDEYDTEEDICRKIDENAYLLSGKIEIDFLNEKYGLNIPSGDYTTIGGFITSYLGRIPLQEENVEINNFVVFIARANQNKIDVVRLTIKPAVPA